jgi:hypothetical protein
MFALGKRARAATFARGVAIARQFRQGKHSMGTMIRIRAGETELAAELNDSATAQAIVKALPIQAAGNRWGEEIYFSIPVRQASAEDARAEMQVGELGYWPPGTAFCLFFGPTPASNDEEPRAASPVNPVGRILDDTAPLQSVEGGATIILERSD